MERIAHRDLRNRSAEILRAVAAGESFEITNHGEVVAVLAPATDKPLDLVKPASVQGRWHDIPRVPARRPTQEILDELREDIV